MLFFTKSDVSMRLTLVLTSLDWRSLDYRRSLLDRLVYPRLLLNGLSSVKSILVIFAFMDSSDEMMEDSKSSSSLN